MTTDRAYRKARSAQEAVAELRRCAGTDFDPAVVEALAEAVAELSLGAQVLLEPLGREAVRLQLVRSLGEAVAFVVEHDVLDLSTQ